MIRLKANKTSLYKLVGTFENLPPMRRTGFVKVYRRPDYRMEWEDGAGMYCEAFFTACGGKPLLIITKKKFYGPIISRVVHTIDLQDLRERGMVENFTTAEERRREERGIACEIV